ncbi:MAG: DUF1697 domain-containing protein [Bryobacteraceae bacterium]|nr:DUF1697 domain-containing protein [Bryobacteraceae bacterium]
MKSFVALLRAVNVGGRTIRMEELRGLFTEMGFGDVRTMLASGNVLFKTDGKATAALEERIAERLQTHFGYEVKTFVRTSAEMAAIAGSAVTSEDERSHAAAVNVAFLERALTAKEREAVLALCSEVDELRVAGREVYWLCRVKQSESRFTNVRLERAAGVRSTIRGWNTVQKLAAALK